MCCLRMLPHAWHAAGRRVLCTMCSGLLGEAASASLPATCLRRCGPGCSRASCTAMCTSAQHWHAGDPASSKLESGRLDATQVLVCGDRCQQLASLGNHPCNLVRWNPQVRRCSLHAPFPARPPGRHHARRSFNVGLTSYTLVQGWGLVLAGFGNLPGEMLFHDCKEDGTYPLAASTRCSTAVA